MSELRQLQSELDSLRREFARIPVRWRDEISVPTIAPYVVTQVSEGENVAIYRETGLTVNANPSYPTFNAQPLPIDDTIDLTAIDASRDQTVYSLCLSGPIFTGQVFSCILGTSKIALGGDNSQFRGTVLDTSGANVQVEISYYSNATTDQTVKLWATNDTGLSLAVDQLVIVNFVNHLNSNTSRFRVSEFTCD